MSIDSAYENLEKFEGTIFNDLQNKPLTESDTRSKILDYLLIQILGWDESEIERERYVVEGYFDYELRTPTFQFLIEAKKIQKELNFPSKGSKVKLKTIYKSNQEVIDQIRIYLFQCGLQYGVISNGRQFIIAKFLNHDGENWLDNTAVYFRDFEDIKKRFTEFYELLSSEYLKHYGRIKIETNEAQAKIITDSSLPFFNDKLNRNRISSELLPILAAVFEEIYRTDELNNSEILKKCYVINDDVDKYSSELNSLFQDLPPAFDSRIAKVKNTKNTQTQIKDDLFTSLHTPDPIIIIGTAGAGKTTFIKNFTENELSTKEKTKRPIVYIDFREFSASEVHDTKYIYSKIIDGIKLHHPKINIHKRNILKKIFDSEIKEKKEGVWENIVNDSKLLENKISDFLENAELDPISHLEKISRYLNNVCQKKLAIVFDNVDQLKDNEQREVFLLAHSINRKLECIVITSLREGYYYRLKDKPPFNAFHSTVYHITAPPYRDVLKKRIEYALDNFQFKPINIALNHKKVDFSEGSIEILFKNLYKTLFEKTNSKVLSFLEETSYPNIRHGLEMFQTFLLSGHAKISEYVSPDYHHGIPFWEFLKAVGLESSYYYTDESKLFNLFLPSNANKNHFTKIRLLNYLLIENDKKSRGLNFISALEIIKDFVSIGYTNEIILEELNLLLTNNLIQSSDYATDIEDLVSLNEDSKIAITTIGNYYITELLYTFTYLDLTLQNTPIYLDKNYQKILSTFPPPDKYGNRDLNKRLETSILFLEYLKTQEIQDLSRPKLEAENSSISLNICEKIFHRTKDEFEKIKKAPKPIR